MPKSAVSAEIHRRLADNQPPEYVALKVGRQQRVIRWHRAGRCQCPERPIPAALALEDDPATGPTLLTLEDWAAMPWQDLAGRAFVAGLSAEEISYELGMETRMIEAAITAETRAEAKFRMAEVLERMREQHPVKWLAYTRTQMQLAKADAAVTTLDPELLAGMFTEIIRHQRRLLIVAEFQDWITWLRELVTNRYPAIRPAIEAAIEAEAAALGSLIDTAATD